MWSQRLKKTMGRGKTGKLGTSIPHKGKTSSNWHNPKGGSLTRVTGEYEPDITNAGAQMMSEMFPCWRGSPGVGFSLWQTLSMR